MDKIIILIIEDDSISALRIKHSLEFAGYEVIGIASNSDRAIDFIKLGRIDVIISDIQIKGELNGIETVELIHKTNKIPTIFLTAHHDDATLQEVSKVDFTGYIVKPYLEEQLLREVKLVSLRYRLNRPNAIIELGNQYYFNTNEQNLYCCNKVIDLTKKELELIQILIQNLGEVVSMEAIELILWYDKVVSGNSLRQLLYRLKSKVQGLTIETLRGSGYKLHKY